MAIIKLKHLIAFLTLLSLWSLSSCKTPSNVEYDLVIDIHEFEIKHSQDLFDREPEAYIQTETEIDIEKSETFNEYKVDFVADAKTYNMKLKGITYSDDFEFSIGLYDFDIFGEDDYIDGITMKIDKDSAVLSETVTVDNDDIYLVFTYKIENLKVND